MSRSKPIVLARALTLLASVGVPCLAQAADLLPPPPPPPPPPPVALDVGGGWYLRGDVGVGAASLTEFETVVGKGSLPNGYAVDRAGLSDQFFGGGGVGYQVNGFLRGDITAEYRGGARIHASDSYVAVIDEHGTLGKGINKYDGNLSSVVLMANGYFDLGTWCGVTPFIGGGVGTAFHTIDGFYDTGFGAASGGFGAAKATHSNSLAWAAMAGFAYQVTPNFAVEVGYRYINMGGAKTGVVECVNDPSCVQAHYKVRNLESHDVRIGLRYLLGGGAVAAPLPPLAPDYAPGPLVSKY